jgi:hypothetical protein
MSHTHSERAAWHANKRTNAERRNERLVKSREFSASQRIAYSQRRSKLGSLGHFIFGKAYARLDSDAAQVFLLKHHEALLELDRPSEAR